MTDVVEHPKAFDRILWALVVGDPCVGSEEEDPMLWFELQVLASCIRQFGFSYCVRNIEIWTERMPFAPDQSTDRISDYADWCWSADANGRGGNHE